MFLRWKFEHQKEDGHHCWECCRWFGFGHSIATVWLDGTWHTWDKNGVGGENDKERHIPFAKTVAKNRAIVQGFV